MLKQELHQLRAYVTSVINPYTWLMERQWQPFLLASNTRQVQSHFVCAKSH